MESSKQEKLTRRRLLMQARRLVRLINLNAPSTVICNEVSLISKTIVLLEDAYLSLTHENALREIGRQKNTIGLCSVKGCNNKVVSDEDESEFGQEKCRLCYIREKRFFDDIEEKIKKIYDDREI
jgi:hypothetical protein